MAERLIRALGAVALAASLAAAAPVHGQTRPAARAPIDTSLELASFDSVWRRVRDTYYDPGMRGLDWNRVRHDLRPLVARAQSRDEVRAAIGQMLAKLGDSHFGVLPGDDLPEQEDAAGADGRPGDLGVDVRIIGGQVVVARVDSASAARRAGVAPGWIVEEVDTLKVAPLVHAAQANAGDRERRTASLRVLINLNRRFQGAPGSRVRVAFRDGHDRRIETTLVRHLSPGTVVRLSQLPPLPTWLHWRRLDGHGGCVGLIRFNTWMTPVANAFEDALAQLRRCQGIVLDLRGNMGGVAAMVVGITGHFVDRQLLLGTLNMRGSELRYTANPRRVTRDGTTVEPYAGPVALLVDELSASTTEIFAAALQQHGRARIFGDTTAGQALPSLLARLPNGDGLLYAVADFRDPGGRRLEGKGIVPDERITLSRSALLAGEDDALRAAVRWIEKGARAGVP